MMKKLKILIAGSFFMLLSACSSIMGYDQAMVVPNAPASITSLQQGRIYVAQGRYELAKEQYLIALAASDSQNKESISQELHAVDMMIKTQR